MEEENEVIFLIFEKLRISLLKNCVSSSRMWEGISHLKKGLKLLVS